MHLSVQGTMLLGYNNIKEMSHPIDHASTTTSLNGAKLHNVNTATKICS